MKDQFWTQHNFDSFNVLTFVAFLYAYCVFVFVFAFVLCFLFLFLSQAVLLTYMTINLFDLKIKVVS